MSDQAQETKAMESKRVARRVEKKRLFLCKAVDAASVDKASTFQVVAGPLKDPTAAVRFVKETLPDGDYVMMFEGKTIKRVTEKITKVVV